MTKRSIKTEVTFLLVFTLIVLFARSSLFRVSGESMSPSLSEGDVVLATFIPTRIKHGEIIIFRRPDKTMAIKRVIGCPGDTIVQFNDQILVSSTEFKTLYNTSHKLSVFKLSVEDHHKNPEFIKEKTSVSQAFDTVNLTGKQYYVLGDNLEKSNDSRLYGPIELGALKKRMILNLSHRQAP